jgi:hypothetical protein
LLLHYCVGRTLLVSCCRDVADRSHLQSLAAAAAAAAAGPGSLLSLPAPLLGGALEEVEGHRLGLVAFTEQLEQMGRDAAAQQQQRAESLQDSEADLAAAMQVGGGRGRCGQGWRKFFV